MQRCEYCGAEFEGDEWDTVCDTCADLIQRQIAEEYEREESHLKWKKFLEEENCTLWDDS